MKETLYFTVTGIDGEMKIRDYMRSRLGFSVSLIAKVKFGGVRLSGEVVHMRAPVRCGDVISVELPEEESECIDPIDIPVEVLYEDDYILAVNKPTNMPTHPSRGNHLPTLAECVRAYLNRPFVFRAISRLDRDTSGIVLIAKNQLSGAILSRSMKAGLFKKTYFARVTGIPSPTEGRIEAAIARECEGSIRRVVRGDGKSAITLYRVMGVDADGNAYVELQPVTGRTHQLRVHMAHIGHPLVGDFLYGERIEGETYHLHCGRLEFPHPADGRIMTVECKDK